LIESSATRNLATWSYTAQFRNARNFGERDDISNQRSGTGSKSRGKRDRAARERALIAAATTLFARRGFEATTTREIAAEAGCAEGLIHRYFQGKAGLLLAIVESRASQEVQDLTHNLKAAPTVQQEVRQLVDFEVSRMWEDREFFRVIIPRLFVDPGLGSRISKIGPLQRAQVIRERLRKYKACQNLSKAELDALAHLVGVIGFMFGFMRPVTLGHDRARARRMAETLASLLGRALQTSIPAKI
jgi:AcrR family transcriptional regulator